MLLAWGKKVRHREGVGGDRDIVLAQGNTSSSCAT